MAFDSVFNGDPTTPNVSASGEAAFGIDLATGQLYYRNPQDQNVSGWQPCAGGGGGSTSDDITNESGLTGATVTDALNTFAPSATSIQIIDSAGDTLSMGGGDGINLSVPGSGGIGMSPSGGVTIEDTTNDSVSFGGGAITLEDQHGDVVELTEGVLFVTCPASFGQFAVASLPASPQEGYIAYATNGLKVGETTGNGTGVPVYWSNGSWRVFSTDQAVAS